MRPIVAVAAVLTLAMGVACAGGGSRGPGRQTVETAVTASGADLFLRWSDRHPWDSELMARGALLVAEYRTRDGTVAMDCLDEGGRAASATGAPEAAAAARAGRRPVARTQACAGLQGQVERRREDRTLRFRMPEATTATPTGPVCLYFRLPNQRVLPVRRADRAGTETARFRYAAWEAVAARQAELRVLDGRVRQLRQAVQVKTADVAAQEVINARGGWTSRDACEQVQPPDVATDVGDRPLAEPREHEDVARRVCTMRVWFADSLLAARPLPQRLLVPVVQSPAVLDRLLALLPQGHAGLLAERQAQAADFRRDWQRLSPGIRDYRDTLLQHGWDQPHFGSLGDYLALQSITAAASTRISEALGRQERAAPADVAGVAGGMLEAYARCVSDGQAQLATSYRNAMELRARAPAVREGLRQSLVRECHGGLDKLEGLMAERARLEAELREAEAARAAAEGDSTLPGRVLDLNGDACQP